MKTKSPKKPAAAETQTTEEEVAERVDAKNVTPLRKAIRDASHVYGKVEWAPGSYQTLRLVKEDLLYALRKDQSENHPTMFQFRIAKDGGVYLGEAKEVTLLLDQIASQIMPTLREHGIALSPDDVDEMTEAFRHRLQASLEEEATAA